MTEQTTEIMHFLKEKVISKTLFTPELVYQLPQGNLEGVYSDRIIFSNLCETAWGFQFDMFIISNEKVYQLDEAGKRAGLNTDFSGVSVFRFELAERKSSGALTGIFRLISASILNQTAQGIACGIYDLKLNGDRLSWKEEQMLYRDQPSGEDTFTPVAFHSDSSFYHKDGKLVFDYQGTCFDVNVSTLEKQPSKSVYPSFVAQER